MRVVSDEIAEALMEMDFGMRRASEKERKRMVLTEEQAKLFYKL